MFEWVILNVKQYLPKLDTDLLDIFLACCEQKLDKININMVKIKKVYVLFCAQKDILMQFKKNIEIKNLKKLNLINMNIYFMQELLKKDNTVYAD